MVAVHKGTNMSKQIVTYGTNESKLAYYGLNSRGVYECANSSITRGITGYPLDLNDCFDRFPSVKNTALALGFITGISAGSSTSGNTYVFDLWTGATAPISIGSTLPAENLKPIHTYLSEPSDECTAVERVLGNDWLGCLWGTPALPFSCVCPNIGSKFYAYLKLRLNVATFWYTPKDTPIKRAEFLDAIKYGKKVNITVGGDFKLKIGQVVDLAIDASSGYPYQNGSSLMNGLYYIVGIKHVVSNSGTHETALALTQIPPPSSSIVVGENTTTTKYVADYP